MKLLIFLLLISTLAYSQEKKNKPDDYECPPGQIMNKDKTHWKCEDIKPLPVSLLYFRGKQSNNLVELNWSTASETNNSHFIVEGSVDAINFKEVAILHTAHTNANFQQYYKIKVKPTPYYRLVQVDLDYSKNNHHIIFVDYGDSTKTKQHTYNVIGQQISR